MRGVEFFFDYFHKCRLVVLRTIVNLAVVAEAAEGIRDVGILCAAGTGGVVHIYCRTQVETQFCHCVGLFVGVGECRHIGVEHLVPVIFRL